MNPSEEKERGPFPTQSDCKRYVVNLDAPPEERWSHVVADFKDELHTVLEMLNDILGDGVLKSLASTGAIALSRPSRCVRLGESLGSYPPNPTLRPSLPPPQPLRA